MGYAKGKLKTKLIWKKDNESKERLLGVCSEHQDQDFSTFEFKSKKRDSIQESIFLW